MYFVYNTTLCTGCRSCEIACAFKHSGSFSRKGNAITIKRNEKDGKFDIVVRLDEEDGHIACDGCRFCVHYCPAVARGELRNALIAAKGGRIGLKLSNTHTELIGAYYSVTRGSHNG